MLANSTSDHAIAVTNELAQCGLHPAVATSPQHARALVEAQGAAIVPGIGPSEQDARNLAYDLLGSKVLAVPPAARVFDGGELDNRAPGLDHTAPLPPHTDGFGYGDQYPDYILLTCVHSCAAGGESFLVDGYRLLELMDQDKQTRWVPPALASVEVDQTEQGMQSAVSPIVQTTAQGRRLLRRTFNQRAAQNSPNHQRDNDMIDAWCTWVDRAAEAAPRFKLNAGDALVVDNYRLLHGREAYTDLTRLMWRVWIWSSDSIDGAPDMPLHSDTRYAHNSAD